VKWEGKEEGRMDAMPVPVAAAGAVSDEDVV